MKKRFIFPLVLLCIILAACSDVPKEQYPFFWPTEVQNFEDWRADELGFPVNAISGYSYFADVHLLIKDSEGYKKYDMSGNVVDTFLGMTQAMSLFGVYRTETNSTLSVMYANSVPIDTVLNSANTPAQSDVLKAVKQGNYAFSYVNRQGLWLYDPTTYYAFGAIAEKELNEGYALAQSEQGDYILDSYGNAVKYEREDDIDLGAGFRGGFIRMEQAHPSEIVYVKYNNSVLANHYSDGRDFKNGYAAVVQGHRWGLIDEYGRFVCQPVHTFVSDVFGNHIAVQDENGLYFYDIEQKERYSDYFTDYDPFPQFLNEQLLVARDGNLGLLDANGTFLSLGQRAKVVVEEYENTLWLIRSSDSGELTKAVIGGKLVDCLEEPVLYQNTITVNAGKKHVLYDEQTGEILGTFDFVSSFSQNLAPALARGKLGYINTQGEWVIPPFFSQALKFERGLAYVEIAEAAGFILHPYLENVWSADEETFSKDLGIALSSLRTTQDLAQNLRSVINAHYSIEGDINVEIDNQALFELTRIDAAKLAMDVLSSYDITAEGLLCLYTDVGELTKKEQAFVAFVTSQGMIEAYEDDTFRPYEVMTEEELYRFVVNVFLAV